METYLVIHINFQSDPRSRCIGGCYCWLTITMLFFSILAAQLVQSEGKIFCNSPEFVYIHRLGMINCSVSEAVYGFYWYYENNQQSIVTLLEDQQAGPRSNELTIARNGSLIFDNITLNDEGRYRVDAILDAGGDVSAFIELTVIVPTTQSSPDIDGHNLANPYYNCSHEQLNLTCSMTGKPPITLTWYINGSEANNVYKTITEPMVSSISIDVNVETGYAANLTCIANGLAVPLDTIEATILLLGPTDPWIVDYPTYLAPNESIMPYCSDDNKVCIVQTAEPQFSSSGIACQTVTEISNSMYPRSLILTSVYNENELFFRDSKLFRQYQAPDKDVKSFIDKCNNTADCDITVTGSENLTCSVHQTVPNADIKWITHGQDISIVEVSSSGSCNLKDCWASVAVKINVFSGQASTIECRVTGPWSTTYHSSNATLSSAATSSTATSSTVTSSTVTSTTASYRTATSKTYTMITTDRTTQPSPSHTAMIILLSLIAVIELCIIVVVVHKYNKWFGLTERALQMCYRTGISSETKEGPTNEMEKHSLEETAT